MKVTTNFDSKEFDCHLHRFRDGTVIPKVAYPPTLIPSTLRPLCVALEALRLRAGTPLIVLSGYRSKALNNALYLRSFKNGKPTGKVAKDSQHLYGRAADVCSRTVDAVELFNNVRRLIDEGQLPQVGGVGLYKKSNFVHVDVRPHKPDDVAYWKF